MTVSNTLQDAMRIPSAGDGARIGLFGGSFNPPHEGHLNLCHLALKRLKLDQIWWMVTPGNPLKDVSALPELAERVALCRAMVRHPDIKITAFEAAHRIRYTADTVAVLTRLRPRLKFVWLMGADNLANFHEWQDWWKIAHSLPIAVIDRPGSTLAYRSARAALALSRYRVDEADASLLADMKAPAWTFLHGPRSPLSSTWLRAQAEKNGSAGKKAR
ncbi:MAG: nicotinate-nucleotide adenylyltransferase [Rhizobiaceae bacterium]|nr:nicotinate-nucleotide adenylyltransferase [Rhizobiaceae bacterium]